MYYCITIYMLEKWPISLSYHHIIFGLGGHVFCLLAEKHCIRLERTEGDIEWRGPLPCPRPGNRGRGRGEVFQTLQWFSGKGRAFSNRGQKGTFPDYNNYLGMKRGQYPVVLFFRGGEGDNTFNGFALFNSNPEKIFEFQTQNLKPENCHFLVYFNRPT